MKKVNWMNKEIVIIGAGFAGMWAALSAARLAKLNNAEHIKISVIAPAAELRIRPRFYESNVVSLTAPLMSLFNTMNVQFITGQVIHIESDNQTIQYQDEMKKTVTKQYDKLVLASGSNLRTDLVKGIQEHAFNIDQIESAKQLENHIENLAQQSASTARNTVIVCGGGFTGIELATELPARFKEQFGNDETIKVIIIERSDQIGSNYSSELQEVIKQATNELDITWMLNTQVEQITANGVTLTSGDSILSNTVIWTAGVQPNKLTGLFSMSQGPQGRLIVDSTLKVENTTNVFATGDVAYAKTDDKGNHALMSCQHAILMGKFAGHNVTASLLDVDSIPYKQENYVTCLDLGAWGAVYTEGWEQTVKLIKDEAKKLKTSITNEWIYPPKDDLDVIMEQANPLAPWV